MDKISKIVAAALLASSIAYVTPAMAADTSAEDFVIGLSSDFSEGDLVTILAKLEELKKLGFEGVLFDTDQMISVEQLIALLTAVQNGTQSGAGVSATLLAYVAAADSIRFIMGGFYTYSANLTVEQGAPGVGLLFPAGSAG